MSNNILSNLKGQILGSFEKTYKGNVFTYVLTAINGNTYENLVKVNGNDVI